MKNKTQLKAADTDKRAWKYLYDYNSASKESLQKTAIIDGNRSITFEEMFKQINRYGSVFSALNMTGKNHSRVGIVGTASANVLYSIYGLNMTGAEVSVLGLFFCLSIKKLLQSVKNEKLTDLILTDDIIQPEVFMQIYSLKNQYGLNNVLYLHVPIDGACVEQMYSNSHEVKYSYIKCWIAPVCMETLLCQYGDGEIDYADNESGDTSFILHTSGTSTGTGKPIPLSDKGLNFFGKCYSQLQGIDELTKDAVCAVTIDFSNAYSLVNQVHAVLAINGTIVLTPGVTMNPQLYKAISAYGVTVMFCTSITLETWIRYPEIVHMDFTTLRGVIIGGSYISADDKKRYTEFLKKHGAKEVTIINGYGLSEVGGACILSSTDITDESVGYPMPGIEVCLYHEETGKCLTIEDAPASGILYIRSEAMTCGELDGKELVKTEVVNGKKYISSNDLVRMDETGKIQYLGRANRFFLNKKGFKYETGRVEVAFAGQPGIENCAIVSSYDKILHDNIPMLCIKTLNHDDNELQTVAEAYRNIFVRERSLDISQIPPRVMIVENLPRNANGKVDIFRINNGETVGEKYSVETVSESDSIIDFTFTPIVEENMLKSLMNEVYKDIEDTKTFLHNQNDNSSIGFEQNLGQDYGFSVSQSMPYFYMMYFQYMYQMCSRRYNANLKYMNMAAQYMYQMLWLFWKK